MAVSLLSFYAYSAILSNLFAYLIEDDTVPPYAIDDNFTVTYERIWSIAYLKKDELSANDAYNFPIFIVRSAVFLTNSCYKESFSCFNLLYIS